MKRVACAVVGLAALGASAQTASSMDAKVQAPVLAAPERGSLVGQLAGTVFGPGDVSRGGFQLPSALGLPTERGGPLAAVLPTYSPESGLSEWGMGWQVTLALTRTRVTGDLDYATDEVTGPWGRMVRGQDGDWYPVGLATAVRLHPEATGGWTAYLPDGVRWTFGTSTSSRVETARGTYAWYPEEVSTALGRKLRWAYAANASGRLFVKAVRYGGLGEDFQYRADFIYEPVARPTTELRSGQALLLDQRVKQVIAWVRNTGTGAMEERWRETLTYEDDALGPAFNLTQVQRTYASGEAAPAVRYGYYKPDEQLSAAALRRNTKLDGVLSQWGADAIQPNRAALLDIDLDGRPDFEHQYDNTLLVQGDEGFTAQPLPAMTATVSSACRRAPSTLNEPRVLAQMRASEDTHQVVALRANGARTQTTFTVCDRVGEPLAASQTLTGDWTLGSNVRLADVNRDRQPDLVRVTAGRVTILPNTSDGTGFSFGAARVVTLGPTFTPDTSWVLDVNGDGVADIVSRGSGSSLAIWLGKGNYAFEPTARMFQFKSSTGIPLSSLTDYGLSFVDANKDGLSDVLLTRISSTGAYLYLNTGSGFTQVQVPALQSMTGTLSRPVVADFAGTGNTEAGYILSGQAYTLGLDAPQTALLRSADDGKGTVLRFEYQRGPATPGTYQRNALLAALQVESSGYDTVRYTYGYEGPTLHSVGHFLVGFGSVTRSGPGLVVAANFLNGDSFSGLQASSTQHDLSSPGVHSYEYHQYEDALFQGIPWKRLKEEGSGYTQEDGQAVGERVEYLAYENEVCPATTVRHTPYGTLTTEKWRAAVSGLTGHLHCLEGGTRLTGTHADSTLDFQNEVHLTRNAVGLVEKVEDVAGSDVLTLQQVVYRPDYLIDTLSAPGRGTTRFEWQPGTLQLLRMTSPDGVVVEGSLHPLTDRPLGLTRWRGTQSVTESFSYDGQERLEKQWDSLGSTSEQSPALRLAYRYASATQPGSVTSVALADAVQGAFLRAVEWRTAAGEGVANGTLQPEGWSVDGLTTRSRNLLETQTHVRPSLGLPADITALDYATLLSGADMVSTFSTSGLGIESQALTRLHADVSRQQATTLSVEGNWLKQESVENGVYTTRRYLDAVKHLVAFEDEAHTRYEYGYDALGRLRRVTLPDGASHRVTLDGHGRPARVDRDGIASVVYGYDALSGLLSVKSFLAPSGQPVREERYTFDGIGRKVVDEHRDVASGATRQYRYSYDGATPDEPSRTDAPGLLTAVEGEGFVKLYAYRADGTLTHSTLRLGGWRTVETQLDHREDGSVREEVVTVRAADGGILSRSVLGNTLDAYGRTASVTLTGNTLATFTHNERGQVTAASLVGSGTVAYAYDGLTHAASGFSQSTGPVAASTSWRFNARGLLDSETLDVGALRLSRAYDYSAQRFLTSSSDAQASHGYGFDALGLPTSITRDGVARPFSVSGAVLQAGSTVYTFDSLGRTATRDDLHFTYGPNGQLARASRGSEAWDFLYDEAGQRLMKLKDGVPVAAYLGNGGYLDATGLTQPFTLAGRLVGVLRDGSFQPLATDMRGTVLSDFDGTPRLASPFGERDVPAASAAALDYVQKGRDADLGLIRMGVRDYDPFINRFTTPDPLFLEQPEQCVTSPVECNLYGYARNLPVLLTDPTGTVAYDADNKQWVAQEGDTLAGIADQVGVDRVDLFKVPANKDLEWWNLRPGTVIAMPNEARIHVFEYAAQHLESTKYAFNSYLDAQFPDGVHKCNRFTQDMVQSAGVPFPRHESWRGKSDRPAVAGTLGDPDIRLDHLKIIPSSEAKIGDIVAYKKDFSDASGHAVINAGTIDIIRLGGSQREAQRVPKGMRAFISPGGEAVLLRSEKYMTDHEYTNPTIRRVQR